MATYARHTGRKEGRRAGALEGAGKTTADLVFSPSREGASERVSSLRGLLVETDRQTDKRLPS